MKRILALILIAPVLVMSCKKENSNEFYPYPNNELNDTNWYSSVPQGARVRELDSIFALPVISDSIDIVAGGAITFPDGSGTGKISILFPTYFLSGGSGNATRAKVEITHLKQKGDMVRMDKPTMSYEQLLVTGGSMQIKVTVNGIEQQLAQGKKLSVRMFNSFSNSNPSNDMRVFYGKEDAYPVTSSQQFTWIPWQDTIVNRVTSVQDSASTSGLRGYEFFTNRFGWVNCDYFSDTMQARTKVNVSLPLNFTNANTNVYAVFKTPDIVAQLVPKPLTRTFSLNNIYVGRVVTFVSMSYIAGKLYLGSAELTVTPNMNVSLVPQELTKQQIETFLNNL